MEKSKISKMAFLEEILGRRQKAAGSIHNPLSESNGRCFRKVAGGTRNLTNFKVKINQLRKNFTLKNKNILI